MTSSDRPALLIAHIEARLYERDDARTKGVVAANDEPRRKGLWLRALTPSVARRVAGLDPKNPQDARKALAVILEAVLITDIGIHVTSEPEFAHNLERVVRHFESKPKLARDARMAAARMLRAYEKRLAQKK